MPIKNRSCLIIILSTLLAATPAVAQETQEEPSEAEAREMQMQARQAAAEAEMARRRAMRLQAEDENLTTFALNFSGGTPGELVQAIEQAMGRPLNAIVPNELADQELPPLKMQGVTVAELFDAMAQASRSPFVIGGRRGWHYVGFKTQGRPSDDSVWYFHREGPAPPPTVSRFYSLTPYLDGGLTVDDITTAIQTGWEMSGTSPKPTLSYHKETNLLIAVGEESQLQTINAVLDALSPKQATPPVPTPEASEP